MAKFLKTPRTENGFAYCTLTFVNASTCGGLYTSFRLYIGDVNIVVPKHWTPPPSSDIRERLNYMGRINRINFESMPIRLYTSKSKTMLSPKAVKGTPCGEQGRYIRIPVGFLDEKFAASFPHPEKTLFYEWAKYKWGVFVSEDSEPCTSVQELFLTPNGTDCTNRKDKSSCFTKIVENMSDQCRLRVLDQLFEV